MVTLAAIKGFLGSVPREVYYIVGAVLIVLAYGQHQYNQGKDAVLERLRQAQIEAEEKAREAAQEADESSVERQQVHAVQSATLEKVIKESQNEGENALDALLGAMAD